MEVAVRGADRVATRSAFAWLRHPLTAVVAAVAVVDTVLSWPQATLVYLPDEYLYSSLSRSLLSGGRPLVQGGSEHFWALLDPILELPVWLVGSVAVGYRLAQAEQSLAMALAAVPVFLLARSLHVERNRAAVIAAVALLVPDTVFSSSLLSESFAFPLFLASIAAALAALTDGGRRRWALFVVLAGLTTAARVQFALLVPLVLVAGAVFEARAGRPRAALRLGAVVGAFALVAAVAGLAGGSAITGRYASLFHLHLGVGGVVTWTSYNAIVLVVAAGWAIVPGAATGLARMLAPRSSRRDAAFAHVTVAAIATLLVEASLFNFGGLETMERYTFYCAPLLAVAFAVAWQRGRLTTRLHAAFALVLVALGLFLPHFTNLLYAQPDGSPSLLAYRALARVSGWNAGIVVGSGAALIALAALGLAKRGHGAALAALAAVLSGALLAGAHVEFYADGNRLAADIGSPRSLPVGTSASFLMFTNTASSQAQEEAFWNRGVDQVVRLGGVGDGFRTPLATVGATGTVLVGGRELDGSLLVDRTSAWVHYAKPPVATNGNADVVPPGAQLRELVDGYLRAGNWLTGSGRLAAWPAASAGRTRGSVLLRVWGKRSTLVLCGHSFEVGRSPVDVRVPFDVRGAWSCGFHVPGFQRAVGVHFVSVHAQILCFEQSRRPCARPSGE